MKKEKGKQYNEQTLKAVIYRIALFSVKRLKQTWDLFVGIRIIFNNLERHVSNPSGIIIQAKGGIP